MTQDPLTLYKLIVLYMLNRVDFPLTKAQITDFILEKEYTTYMNLQSVLAQLRDSNMIMERTIRNRTQLLITEEGKTTLGFFENRISPEIKKDIETYLQEKSISLKEEASLSSEVFKGTDGEYKAHLIAREKHVTLLDLTISVPTETIAQSICEKWERKSQDVYQFLIEQLF